MNDELLYLSEIRGSVPTIYNWRNIGMQLLNLPNIFASKAKKKKESLNLTRKEEDQDRTEVNQKIRPSCVYVWLLCDLLQYSRYQCSLFSCSVLNNYLIWQTVRSLTTCLSRPFRDAYKGLRKALVGTEGGEESWRYCVTDTNNVLGFAVGAVYVREAFQGRSKLMVSSMFAYTIKTHLTQRLKQ